MGLQIFSAWSMQCSFSIELRFIGFRESGFQVSGLPRSSSSDLKPQLLIKRSRDIWFGLLVAQAQQMCWQSLQDQASGQYAQTENCTNPRGSPRPLRNVEETTP